MKRFMNKKVAAIGLAAGLALGAAGAAFAYFTSSGTGTGTAATTGAIANDLTFSDTVGSITPADLAPSVPANDFTTTVTNNNATQEEYVTTLKAYVTVVESATGLAYTGTTGYTCSSADYVLDGTAGTTATNLATLAWTGTDLAHAGGHASTAGTDTLGFEDLTSTNQDACIGAAVTVNYVAS